MSETCGAYTVTATNPGGGVVGEIDVHPPFTPSQEFLDLCSGDLGTTLQHFVTTPNTTRLKATIKDEGLSFEERNIAVQATASVLANLLNAVDEGRMF